MMHISKGIQHLVEPHSRHDEEQLDTHSPERQNASQSDAEHWMGVPDLFKETQGEHQE